MKCWPQHLLQTYPIWQSLLMDKNKSVKHRKAQHQEQPQ